jgi:MYXO-CTERM domain-containing protein
VVLLGDLGDPDQAASMVGEPGAEGESGVAPLPAGAAGAAVAAVAAVGRGTGPGPAPAGIATLGFVGLMGVAAAYVHRRRSKRLLRARIVARLDAITGPGTAPAGIARDVPA